jgi:hypothetical protein
MVLANGVSIESGFQAKTVNLFLNSFLAFHDRLSCSRLAVWGDRLLDAVIQVSLKSEYFYLNRSRRMRFVEEVANFFCGFSAEGGFTTAIADLSRNVFYEDGFTVDVKNFVHLFWVRLG